MKQAIGDFKHRAFEDNDLKELKNCEVLEDILTPSDMQIYVSINVSSQLSALNKIYSDIMNTLLNNSNGDKTKNELIENFFEKSITSRFVTALHGISGDDSKHNYQKNYMDTDVDVDDPPDMSDTEKRLQMFNYFQQHDLFPFIALTIKTRGGYHILWNIKNLGPKNQIVHNFSRLAVRSETEVNHISTHHIKEVHNKDKKMKTNLKCWFNLEINSQVPLPGTWQGDFKVRCVDLLEDLSNVLGLPIISTTSSTTVNPI